MHELCLAEELKGTLNIKVALLVAEAATATRAGSRPVSDITDKNFTYYTQKTYLKNAKFSTIFHTTMNQKTRTEK